MALRAFCGILCLSLLSGTTMAQNAGRRDSTFLFTGASGLQVLSLAEQPDGKLLVAGDFTALNRASRRNFGRLKENGTVDSSFLSVVIPNAPVRKIGLQPNGKIIIAGGFNSVSVVGTPPRTLSIGGIFRMNADGSPDVNFYTNAGSGFDGTVDDFAVLPNGNIIVVGGFFTYNGTRSAGYMMLDSTGRLDANFARSTAFINYTSTVLGLPDGKFLMTNNNLRKVNSDGSAAAGFTMSPTISVLPNTLAMQSDGKILIGGDFTTVGTAATPRIARFNTDGTLDNTFNPGTGFDARVRNIIVSLDDKIYVTGDFRNVNGIGRNRIARLNPDGSFDATFDPGAGLNNPGFTQQITRAGKLVVGGNFYTDVLPNTRINYLTRFIGPGVIVSSPKAVEEKVGYIFYPNPAQDMVRIQTAHGSHLSYTLTNMQGQVVLSGTAPGNETELNIGSMAPGVYMLHVKGAGVQRLIKQ